VITIRQAAPSDWEVVKAVRLRALADAPDAYVSTLEEESAFPDAVWIERLERAHQLLAFDGSDAVGMATGLPDGQLVAMWVAPSHRRSGVATTLIAGIVEWARKQGMDALRLWVADGNDGALRLYLREGFVPTSERGIIREGLGEQALTRAL
jgi:ribosomal protein S18 acetylase RimI-like enzyme